jgi:hypothetical protein
MARGMLWKHKRDSKTGNGGFTKRQAGQPWEINNVFPTSPWAFFVSIPITL